MDRNPPFAPVDLNFFVSETSATLIDGSEKRNRWW